MRNFAAWALVAGLIAFSAACGSDGSSSGSSHQTYIIVPDGPPAVGVQVDRPFSVTLNFTSPDDGTPVTVQSSQTIEVTADGPGALSGDTLMPGDGGSILVFDNLILDATGSYTLTFSGSRAAEPVATAAFEVGEQFDLRFRASPDYALVGEDFSIVIETVNPSNGEPAEPAHPVTITIGVESGGGALNGETEKTLDADTSLLFSNLSRDVIGDVYFRASAYGFPTIVSERAIIDQPASFAALKSVRVGNPYSDSVAFAAPNDAVSFGLLSGSLPSGLELNADTGQITGTPTTPGSYAFSLYASRSDGPEHLISCALAVFSQDETEIIPGQNFSGFGPHAVAGPTIEMFSFTSSFDGDVYPPDGQHCRLQITYPVFTTPEPAPVFIQHRGRGFTMSAYLSLGLHLARHGITYITVESSQSFDGGVQAPIPQYDNITEYGMQSASAFQEAAMRWALARNTEPGHYLEGMVDPDRVFMGGHSRGGGGTHGSHVRSQPYLQFDGAQRLNHRVRGVVYFMAYDQRVFPSTELGTIDIYPIPTAQPRLPSLIIAAENDGDLFYPVCDQFIDRATGPATFATIYGGVHNYLSDFAADEGGAYITRQQQQQRTNNLLVAFIKRWADLDLSLEGLLYNNEFAGSDEVGVTAWRNMAERVLVDDHQNGLAATNTLGGSNSLDGPATISIAESVYPVTGQVGGLTGLGLRHAIMTLQPEADVTYTLNIPLAYQDVSQTRRLIFRIGSIEPGGSEPKGFDWVTIRARLVDTQAESATVTLFDRQAPDNTYLPVWPGSGPNVYDRFVEANVLLEEFTESNASLDLSLLQQVELIFETAEGESRQLYFDDIRFE